jgi:murein DD-endopeptidase MepM/ murein hydrolase activator NlpD
MAAGVIALTLTSLSPAAAQTIPPPSPSPPPTPPAPTLSPPPVPKPSPPEPKPAPRPSRDPRPPAAHRSPKRPETPPSETRSRPKRHRKHKHADDAANEIWWTVGYRVPGTYSTAPLISAARELRELGITSRRARSVFQPFIVAGYASWWDSWGEVRLGTHGVRPHLGQDVFCNQGAPVLAAEPGRIEFTFDDLGGMVARLHRDVGSFWYYAHLSGFSASLASGDYVERGDVIGFCGNTGNAKGSSPHVHFGLYSGGVAQNPMQPLVSWLHQAEARAARLIRRARPNVVKVKGIVVRGPSDPRLANLSSLSCDPLPYPTPMLAMISGAGLADQGSV